MRSIASSVRRVTCGVFLATRFTLVGCGGTSLRRPLVTDQTPLGSTRAQVVAWHRANGWCQTNFPPELRRTDVASFRPCDRPDRHRLSVLLAFSRRDELVGAVVTVHVPRPAESVSRTGVLPRRSSPRDQAINVVEGLAVELEARYGAPLKKSWTERAWATRTELVELRWVEIAEDIFIVTETHQPQPLSSL